MTTHPVVDDIVHFFPATIELATAAIIVGVLIGVPLGVFAAVRQGTRIDHAMRVFCLAGQSVPVFLLGAAVAAGVLRQARLGAGHRAEDVAYEGMVPRGDRLADHRCAARRRLGRACTTRSRIWRSRRGVLAYFCMAYITRMTRAFMLDALPANTSSPRAPRGFPARASSGGTPSATSRCG